MSRTRRTARTARGAVAPIHPARRALLAAFILAAVGLALSLYLARLHVRAHAGFVSFCDVNEVVNCDRVATSRYSVALGIPVAVWGAAGYVLMGLLAALGLARRGPHPGWPSGLLFALAGAASTVSVVLALVSELAIGAWCLVCAASWLVSFGLLAASWLACRPLGGPLRALRTDASVLAARPVATGIVVLAAAGAMGAVGWLYPRYWSRPAPRVAAGGASREVRPAGGGLPVGAGQQAEPKAGASGTKPTEPAGPTGAIPPSRPAEKRPGATPAEGTVAGAKRGAAAKRPPPPSRVTTIFEYSDYECPYCALAHEQTRALLASRSDVRIVHRQFPLDAACNPSLKRTIHPDACAWARAGICGEEQGKSKAMDDALFANQKDRLSVEAVAERAGLDLPRFKACLDAPETERRLAEDVAAGRREGISGTPTYVIDGRMYLGRLPESILDPAQRSASQP